MSGTDVSSSSLNVNSPGLQFSRLQSWSHDPVFKVLVLKLRDSALVLKFKSLGFEALNLVLGLKIPSLGVEKVRV